MAVWQGEAVNDLFCKQTSCGSLACGELILSHMWQRERASRDHYRPTTLSLSNTCRAPTRNHCTRGPETGSIHSTALSFILWPPMLLIYPPVTQHCAICVSCRREYPLVLSMSLHALARELLGPLRPFFQVSLREGYLHLWCRS